MSALVLTTLASHIAAVCFLYVLPPYSWAVGGLFECFALYTLVLKPRNKCPRKIVARLKGMKWTREDFCRGWLITGDTGSGKTRSGITPLLYEVFSNETNWGGVCIDNKGVYWETLSAMAKHFGREDDLILLQVKPDNAPANWKPNQTYNLTSDRGIPFNTYAKFVVDTAGSLGSKDDKGFFRNQAQTHIALALELLYEISVDVTLENTYNLLTNKNDLDEALNDLGHLHQTNRRREIQNHFQERYLKQPPNQRLPSSRHSEKKKPESSP